MADEREECPEKAITVPPVARPEKNVNIFELDENVGVFPPGLYDGELGPLPLLFSVSVGYDPEVRDPYMYHYESQEIMFAYKKGAQKRVLLRDSFGRTLSLPLHSRLTFRQGEDPTETTMAHIVSTNRLPVSPVRFARADKLEFKMDKKVASHLHFGSLTVTQAYDEPYLRCLVVQPNGEMGDSPIVLPRNLKNVGLCPVVGIRGAEDPSAKVKEFLHHYNHIASQLTADDPFFQELALVSPGPDPVTNVQPYIDETTFIPIHINPSPPTRIPPPPPSDYSSCLPPRPSPHKPVHPHPHHQTSTEKKEEEEEGEECKFYSQPTQQESPEHFYDPPVDRGPFKSRYQVAKPWQKPHADTKPSGESGNQNINLVRPVWKPSQSDTVLVRPVTKHPEPDNAAAKDPIGERPKLREPRLDSEAQFGYRGVFPEHGNKINPVRPFVTHSSESQNAEDRDDEAPSLPEHSRESAPGTRHESSPESDVDLTSPRPRLPQRNESQTESAPEIQIPHRHPSQRYKSQADSVPESEILTPILQKPRHKSQGDSASAIEVPPRPPPPERPKDQGDSALGEEIGLPPRPAPAPQGRKGQEGSESEMRPEPQRNKGQGDPASHSYMLPSRPPPVPPRDVIQPHLRCLSVEDVGQKLKELGLERYVKKFRKKRIDGVLLHRVREKDLKEEFNMSHLEFLLLDTFMREGHIPQINKGKTLTRNPPK